MLLGVLGSLHCRPRYPVSGVILSGANVSRFSQMRIERKFFFLKNKNEVFERSSCVLNRLRH